MSYRIIPFSMPQRFHGLGDATEQELIRQQQILMDEQVKTLRSSRKILSRCVFASGATARAAALLVSLSR